MADVAATLLVVYTEQLAECVEFYAGLGLPFAREQHGSGPVHYAAELVGGLVVELYPGTDRTTDRLRLGLTVPASPERLAGRHQLTDPDGRVVDVHAVEVGADEVHAADVGADGVHAADVGADGAVADERS